MSSNNSSPLLSVRPRLVLASRPPPLRGEDFGSNGWSATEYDRDTDRSCWSPLSGFMQRSRHHSLRSCASQPLPQVLTIILCEARGLWLLWVTRGGIGFTRTLDSEGTTQTAYV